MSRLRIETSRSVEALAGLGSGVAAWSASRAFDVTIADPFALYGAMATSSVGLLTVCAISVSLSSSLIPDDRVNRLASAAGPFTWGVFSSAAGLLAAVLLSVSLFAVTSIDARGVRFFLVGAWLGLVTSAGLRTLLLGRLVLLAVLRDAQKR